MRDRKRIYLEIRRRIACLSPAFCCGGQVQERGRVAEIPEESGESPEGRDSSTEREYESVESLVWTARR